MTDSISRRLTLMDMMILVASAAVGLAAGRFAWHYDPVSYSYPQMRLRALSAFALAGPIGLIPLFLKPPRPPLHRISQQPGLTASFTVVFTSACVFLCRTPLYVIEWALGLHEFNWFWIFESSEVLVEISYPTRIGHAVAACWMIQFLSGRWRAEPNLPDRLGRFWGVSWIVLAIVFETWVEWAW